MTLTDQDATIGQHANTTRGRFITLEGGDGCGKTTQAGLLVARLRDLGIDCVRTREPGGTKLGDQIRQILLQKLAEPLSAKTELMLFFAVRTEHIEKIIAPALQCGRWVVCERFTDSTYAYQGGGRELSMADIAHLEAALPPVYPDLTLLLDLPPTNALKRKKSALDQFEQQSIDFHNRVRDTYRKRAQAEPERIKVVSAEPAATEVYSQIQDILRHWPATADLL